MSCGRRRGLRSVSPYAIVLALAIALTASFFLPLRAEAAISDHTVPTISPSGTTINLFDYWVNPDDHLSVSGSGGVNAGHKFQFNDGKGDGPLNQWTGGTSPRPGIVNNTLSDGYPKLSDTGRQVPPLSVRFLCPDRQDVPFWRDGPPPAQGGYYVYDSTHNYAAYNANKNAFDIYDTGALAIRPTEVSSSRSTRQTRCSMRKTTGSSKYGIGRQHRELQRWQARQPSLRSLNVHAIRAARRRQDEQR